MASFTIITNKKYGSRNNSEKFCDWFGTIEGPTAKGAVEDALQRFIDVYNIKKDETIKVLAIKEGGGGRPSSDIHEFALKPVTVTTTHEVVE